MLVQAPKFLFAFRDRVPGFKAFTDGSLYFYILGIVIFVFLPFL
jgi:hypothetical protein